MKIAVVGAGNAGCISALSALKIFRQFDIQGEVEIYYDRNVPIQKVGQGNSRVAPKLTWEFIEDWDDFVEKTGTTIKTGILYHNWGTKNEWNFHPFGRMNGEGWDPKKLSEFYSDPVQSDWFHNAFHYIPKKFSEYILGLKQFKTFEKTIVDPEKEIDSDVIIDCRGKSDDIDYEKVINPINSVLIARKEGADPDLKWSGHIATPHGWTFEIPNTDSVSYGYLYNSNITTKEEATEDFLERFNLPSVDFDMTFDPYWAKNPFVGERTFVNGNRHAFIEPLEANSSDIHGNVASAGLKSFLGHQSKEITVRRLQYKMWKWESFFLWHYRAGSAFDTPFWNYAKNLDYREEAKSRCMETFGGGEEEKFFGVEKLCRVGNYELFHNGLSWDHSTRLSDKKYLVQIPDSHPRKKFIENDRNIEV